ncbi:MAG TPA: cupin domain-containing protein [Chloroflexota bacterium]|nr:cupin domain-containing protein [Chloroflexota bacterium]
MPVVERVQQPWTQTRPGVKWQFITGGIAEDGDAPQPGLTMFYQEFEPGYGVPRHKHELGDEIITILEGEAETLMGQQVSHVGPGATLHIRQGTVHSFRNTGDGPLRVECVLSASLLKSEFFEDPQAIPAAY